MQPLATAARVVSNTTMNQADKPMKRLLILLLAAPVLLSATFALGFQEHRWNHPLQTSDNPPGVAGRNAVLANQNLAGYVQPVHILGPEGSLLSMWTGQGLQAATSSDINVGLMIGYAYRLKVSHIPLKFGAEVYPSIELLDRMYPPPGLEAQFPIQIVLSQDDLEKAIRGKLVTKVIYVENPEKALPFAQQPRDDQPAIQVNGTTDPLGVAGQLGRAVAIVRIGSRTPTPEEAGSPGFDFLAPVTDPLPAPLPTLPDMEYLENNQEFENRLNDTTRPVRGAVEPDGSRDENAMWNQGVGDSTSGQTRQTGFNAGGSLERPFDLVSGFEPLLPDGPKLPPVLSGEEYLQQVAPLLEQGRQ